MKIFTSKGITFITLEFIISLFIFWFIGGLFIALFINTNSIIYGLFAAPWIMYPIPYVFVRLQMFKYNKQTSLSIDITNKVFVYKRQETSITFKSSDIRKWVYYDFGPASTNFVEIIELYLNDGRKISIYSGIGNVNFFLRKNKKELGLPIESRSYGVKHLIQYMKAIDGKRS